MPLSWNEIKDRALRFSREWADEASEDAEAQSFWNGFFDVFGVSRRRVANFEKKVKKIDGRDGYIDLLWKGVLLVEHKSRGHDLDRAHAQARDYFHGLSDAELPRYLLVSDFARFRLYDLEGDGEPIEFALKDLHKHVRAFGFIAGYQARSFKDEDPVNIEAAERMGRLHDALKAAGYAGHGLEVLLVRLLFCLFAEDTGISGFSAMIESPQPIPPIVIDRAVCGGRPVLTYTRVLVAIVVGSVAGGMTFEQVMSEYDLSMDQIRGALAYASACVDDESVHPLPSRAA